MQKKSGGDPRRCNQGRRTVATTLRCAAQRWPALLLILFLTINLAHDSPLNLSADTLRAAAQIASHGHMHDAPSDEGDGDGNVHVHPAADRVASIRVQPRLAGSTPLYRRTTRIALHWPSTIPLKPPSLSHAT